MILFDIVLLFTMVKTYFEDSNKVHNYSMVSLIVIGSSDALSETTYIWG